MSIIDEIKESNARQAEEKANTAIEHMKELERQRVLSESYVNPHIVNFKKRRAQQYMQNKVCR